MDHGLATIVSYCLALIGVTAAAFGVRNVVQQRSRIDRLEEQYRPAARASCKMSLVVCFWVTIAFLWAAVMVERNLAVCLALVVSPLFLGLALIPVSRQLLAKYPSDPDLEMQVAERMKRFLPRD